MVRATFILLLFIVLNACAAPATSPVASPYQSP